MNSNISARLDKVKGVIDRRKEGRTTSANVNIYDHIAPVYYGLHEDIKNHQHQNYNLPGGRGSGKSSFAALEIVSGIMADPTGQSNAIVFRLVAATLRDSVYSTINWAIDKLGVSHLWKPLYTPLRFEYIPTGAAIYFRGLDSKDKLKSIKPLKGIFRYVWYEEFSELPGAGMLRSINQSVIRGGNNFVVFRTFNPPISLNNWANRYIEEPDEKGITLLTDYTMLPPEWLGEDFIFEAERLREVNETAYKHEYLGLPVGTGGEVFPNVEVREITDAELQEQPYIYQGLDFGFATDPAAFIRLAYDRRKETVYMIDEIYKRHCSNYEMAEEIKERQYNDYAVIADSAEPKSIADIRDNGVLCRATYKPPNCVKYRVKWLQHRRIIIDPARTPATYKEFINYSYPIDKNGELLSDLPDKDNHTIDATAYALTNIIFARQNSA